MKQELKDKIKDSNRSCNALENNGYSLNGRTLNLEKVAVINNEGRTFLFKDYVEAHRLLIGIN